jgi:IS30 family transposase
VALGSRVGVADRRATAELDRIADSLYGRPRKTLGYLTPSEKLAELFAHTG